MIASWIRSSALAVGIAAFFLTASAGPQTASAGPTTPTAAQTQAAAAALQKYAAWLQQPTGSNIYGLTVHVSSVDPGQHYASFAQIPLAWKLAPNPAPRGVTKYNELDGTGSQFFSNRLWGPTPPPNTLSNPTNPFNPNKTDSLGVSINCSTATLTLTLKSWGNTQVVVPLQTEGGVFFGFSTDSNVTMYVLEFQESTIPVPK